MTTISNRGWRRDEPGLVNTIEQPSILPRAVELLAEAGIDEQLLIEQCRVPPGLFRTVTSRAPDSALPGAAPPFHADDHAADGKVISLLVHR
jgi:hypothetical protein